MDKSNHKITFDGIKQDAEEHFLSITGKKEEVKQLTLFPMDSLPSFIHELVMKLHDGFGYPIDFSIISLLCAVATCIGNSLRIVKKTGWIQPATLFCALVGRPGTCKSHPVNFAYRPLEKIDMKNYEKYCAEMEDFEKDEALAKAKGKDGLEELANLSRPKRKQIIVSDVTIEALTKISKENPRGICLKMDELIGLIKNMMRYGKGSDQQKLMEIWSYQPLHVDRVMSGSIPVNEPFCCIIGTIQPAVLQELAADNRRSDGFMDRFIFIMPTNIGPNYWDQHTGSTDNLEEEWAAFIEKLMIRGNERIARGDTTVRMSEEANKLLDEWQRKNEDIMKTMPDNIASAYSKLETYVLRFTLIFHELCSACNDEVRDNVSPDSVKRATMMMEYLRENMMRVNGTLDLSKLNEREKDVYQSLPEQFKKKDGNEIVSKAVGWSERQLTRFLTRYLGSLFRKTNYGEYKKIYVCEV